MKQLNYLLGYENLKIYQDTDYFKFSLDSILLPNFVKIKPSLKQILDIGTGNAVIPIILSTKTSSNITGIEIQQDIYDLAVESLKINNLENRIKLINDDIKNYYEIQTSDTYDLITCNPPYFKLNENSTLNLDDHKKVARHELSLNLDDIMKISKKLLKNGGSICLVHRPDRLIEIINLMKKNNIEPKRIRFVYPKIGKDANILLIEGVKNGNSSLIIESPLYVYNGNGTYTEDIKKYFS